MKCRICNREMKNATEDGIGPVCRRKMNGNSLDAARWKVEILERMKLSKILRVFNQSESWKVTIYDFKQFGICGCKQVGCQHVGIAKQFLRGETV